MRQSVTRSDVVAGLSALGIASGDTVLVRGALGQIGRLEGGARTVVEALLEQVGEEGTIVSLAFTETAFIRKPDPAKPFTPDTPTYAGALPKAMLAHPHHFRSRHPNCSFVAIGHHAEQIVAGHGADDGAYEPVRKLIDLDGKGLLIGCVQSSPGFTTAHLAEADLRLYRRVVLPRLNSVYYRDEDGQTKLFKRSDHGLCSQGFSRFYEHYVEQGLLKSGSVGAAYSIVVPLREAFAVEYKLLAADPRFAICDNVECVMCNVRRWDRLHHAPGWLVRRILNRFRRSSHDA